MGYVARSSLRTVLLVFFLGVYLVVGAVVFSLIEGPREEDWRDKLRQKRSDFLESQECVTGKAWPIGGEGQA